MSAAVVSGGHVHISGQVADDRTVSVEVQTRQVMQKVGAYLEQAGSSREKLARLVRLSKVTTKVSASRGWSRASLEFAK